jgi:hypothetical protein
MKWPKCGFCYFTMEKDYRIWHKCSKPWGHWFRKSGMPHEGGPL